MPGGNAWTYNEKCSAQVWQIGQFAMRAAGLGLRQYRAIHCAAHLPSWLWVDKKGRGRKTAALVEFICLKYAIDSVRGIGGELGKQLAHLFQSRRVGRILQDDSCRRTVDPRHGTPVRDFPFLIGGEQPRLAKQREQIQLRVGLGKTVVGNNREIRAARR